MGQNHDALHTDVASRAKAASLVNLTPTVDEPCLGRSHFESCHNLVTLQPPFVETSCPNSGLSWMRQYRWVPGEAHTFLRSRARGTDRCGPDRLGFFFVGSR